jgi:hypothetical protein
VTLPTPNPQTQHSAMPVVFLHASVGPVTGTCVCGGTCGHAWPRLHVHHRSVVGTSVDGGHSGRRRVDGHPGGRWTPQRAMLTGRGPPDPQTAAFLPFRHRKKADRFVNRRGITGLRQWVLPSCAARSGRP